MKALVTGGAGFIGSHLTERLISEGYSVRVLDDLSTGHLSNLDSCREADFIEGRVEDFDQVNEVVAGCDWVFHQAAIASVPKTVSDPLGSVRVNYLGTVNMLEACRRNSVGKVVFAASSAAYGNLDALPARESDPTGPLSPYAVDKLASEMACRVYNELHGVQTVSLRYFNVYGPRQDPASPYSGVISLFVRALQEGKAPTILGDGQQTRDFVYVSDVVEANLAAAKSSDLRGATINVGTGRTTSIAQLFSVLCELEGVDIQPKHGEARAGEVRNSVACIDLAEQLLDWKPGKSLREGLAQLLLAAAN